MRNKFMERKMRRKWLLCLCCALAFTSTTALATACDDDEEQSSSSSSSSVLDLNEDGAYYCEIEGQDGLLTLVETSKSFTLTIGTDTMVGSYAYIDTTSFKMTFSGTNEQITATYLNETVSFIYQGVECEFVKVTEYTVTLNVDGATSTVTAIGGKLLTKPQDPVKTDYNFVAWYLDSEFKVPFEFNTMKITENITLYARFTPKVAGALDYVATLFVDGAEYGEITTVSGKVFNLPTPEKAGATFVGWWVSDYQNENELTAEIKEGDTLKENVNLYAVWKSNALNVSVSATKITWNEMSAMTTYSVKVYNQNNALVNGSGWFGDSEEYEFNFAQYPAGKYKIEVQALGVSTATTVYYQNKGLDRVSLFSVENSVLTFAEVENAEAYYLDITCGTQGHTHERIALGTNTSYNFSACEIGEEGIVFTVTAEAEGYESSVSAPYTFDQKLSAVTNVTISEQTQTLRWDQVNGATEYCVKITKDGTTNTVYTEKTSYTLKYHDAGAYTIEISPLAKGYKTPESTVFVYEKTTVATPMGLALQGNKLIWNAVTGATSYVVKIGSKEFTVSTNELVLTNQHYDSTQEKTAILVRAVGASADTESPYSDTLYIRENSMSELTYQNGVVSWDSVLSASKYYVVINDGEAVELDASTTSYTPEFDKSGDNVISVYFVTDGGSTSATVSVTVRTYALEFNTDGGLAIQPVYKATGDPFTLPATATKTGYKFIGWYTQIGGEGEVFTKTTFDYNTDYVIYAAWQAEKYVLTLNYNGATPGEITTKEVTYKQAFELPIPKHSDESYEFVGWYNTESNGVAGNVQYTDEKGISVGVWALATDTTVTAKWKQTLAFKKETGGYSVRAGRDIDQVTHLVIPATYLGEKVISISANAFQNCDKLVEIKIPDTILNVDVGLAGGHGAGSAFIGCGSLEKVEVYCSDENGHAQHQQVYFSESNSLIYDNKEQNRKELVFVPEAITGEYIVPSSVNYIPIGAFEKSKLDSVQIPATVSYVGMLAFDGSKIKSITFEDGAGDPLIVDELAFRKCVWLTEINFPSRLDSFNSGWFEGCTVLEKINITTGGRYSSKDGAVCESATLIYAPVAFRKGHSQEVYTIPSGITAIGERAFAQNRYVQKLNIPYSVTEIGASAFEEPDGYNHYLREVTFGDREGANLLNIREKAFYNCVQLTRIDLPENIGAVEAYAFGNAKNLTHVTVHGNEGLELKDYAFANTKNQFFVTNVYLGKTVPAFNIAGVFGSQELRLVDVEKGNLAYESGTQATGDEGVLYTAGKTAIVYYPASRTGDYVIPPTVTEIGPQVFRDKAITSITIGANVTKIGDAAFYGCENLAEIIFTAPENGETAKDLIIGKEAFYNTSIVTITLPERVVEIGDSAFYGCELLTSVYIGEKVAKMGEYTDGELTAMNVFYNCTSLQTITVHANNKAFKVIDGVLYGLTEQAKADAPEEYEYIVTDLFVSPVKNAGTNGSVVIPNTVTKMWDNAFAKSEGIKNISFSDAVSEDFVIGAKVFYRSNVESVILPSGLTEIAADTFTECGKLKYVFVPNTVEKIYAKAFYVNSLLSEIEFEDGDTPLTFVEGDTSTSSNKIGAIYGNKSLTSLTLPERTTAIGAYAFANNTGLTQINIPAKVTNIGAEIFSGNQALRTVTFAETGALRQLGKNMFQNLKSLQSVVLPNGLTGLQDGAFSGCISLRSVVIPEGVEKINNSAFLGCIALESVVIPNSVTSIEAHAFEGALQLQYVVIDKANSTLATIGEKAFYGCEMLNRTTATVESGATATFALPITVTTVGKNAFYGCEMLTNLTFEHGGALEKLDDQAFAYTGIKTFVFPNNTVDSAEQVIETKFGKMVFAGCHSLTSVTISNAITDLVGLFQGCYTLTELNVDPSNAYFKVYIDNGAIFVMNVDATAYRYVIGEISGAFNIREGITDIGEGVFADYNGITSISIPASVQSIAANAFSCCENLTTVTIAQGSKLISIGANAFEGCTSLQSVQLENATVLSAIGDSAFENCTALRTANLPEGALSNVGKKAFANTALTAVVIPTTLSQISEDTFANCTNLADATLHQNVVSLGARAFKQTALDADDLAKIFSFTNIGYGEAVFENCANVTEITIPAEMRIIPSGLFKNCTSLVKVNFHDGVAQIGANAFEGCINLTNVKLPTSLQDAKNAYGQITVYAIGEFAFAGCESLTTITIPDGVTALGKGVFANCINLESFTLPKTGFDGFITGSLNWDQYSKSHIKNATFYNCQKLGDITLPNSVSKIGYAFAGSGIKSITMNITNLGGIPAQAFNECRNLTAFIYKGSLKSGMSGSIGGHAFYNCVSLTTFKKSTDTENAIYKGITSIGNNAFEGCSSLTSLKFPETCETGGNSAFLGCGFTELDLSNFTKLGIGMTENCANLTKITFNDNLATMPQSMFLGCSSLTELTLPSQLTTWIAYTGTNAAINGGELRDAPVKKLVIPSKLVLNAYTLCNSLALEEVEFTCTTKEYTVYSMFRYSTKLKKVTFASEGKYGVTKFSDAFIGCTALEEFEIPETVREIGPNEFMGCTSLREMIIPDSVGFIKDGSGINTSKKEGLFSGCTSLERVEVESGANSFIPAYAFYNCTSLEEVIWSDGITEIHEYAFFGTQSLQSYALPETLTTIRAFAFTYSGIATFYIPATLTSISEAAFGSQALKGFIVDPASTAWKTDSNGALYSSADILFVYPAASCVDENGVLTVPEGVDITKIGGGAFIAENIKKIILPDGFTTVKRNMFGELPNLQEVYLPDSVTSIDVKAFYNCKNLITVRMPAGLTSIGQDAFGGCTALQTLTNMENVTKLGTIGDRAFQNCSSLQNFYFAPTVGKVGMRAFENCVEMKVDVDLSRATSLGDWAFNHSGITSIVFPTDMTIIGSYNEQEYTVPYYAYDYMANMPYLTSINLSNIKIVGCNAFQNCPALKTLIYSDNLYAIGGSAFLNSGLETFTVRANITQWGESAFQGSALKEIIFEEGCTDLKLFLPETSDYHAGEADWGCIFAGCKQLKTVVFPDTFEYIEVNTFRGCTALENVFLPSSVTVGRAAFYGMKGTLHVAVSKKLVRELWDANWKQGFQGEIVYNATRPTTGSDEE